MPGQDSGAQACFWSREPRGCVACVPLARSLAARSSAPPHMPAMHTHPTHVRTEKSGVKSNLDTTWPGSLFRTKTLLPSDNPPPLARLSTTVCTDKRRRHPASAPAPAPASCLFPTRICQSCIMIRPTCPLTTTYPILQISVPGPNAENGPLAPLAGPSPPA